MHLYDQEFIILTLHIPENSTRVKRYASETMCNFWKTKAEPFLKYSALLALWYRYFFLWLYGGSEWM